MKIRPEQSFNKLVKHFSEQEEKLAQKPEGGHV